MKKILVWSVVSVVALIGFYGCESRIEKGMKKYQGLTAAQKAKCVDHYTMASNFLTDKAMGLNLNESKSKWDNSGLLSPEMKISAPKLADLIYSKKELGPNDLATFAQVVCAEDMK